ncbi:S1C family serine protease [Variovorax sp. J22R133]|uniref:S1C family serine protease n=1 Tax=Variovorax brevis TaxID=3053503 RepID=UPI002575A406|nr:S1C family serine protease [Variovorax sp. J22R133]MDM0111798.1 S1C family serine protease [Variovorax sp. J22R133]
MRVLDSATATPSRRMAALVICSICLGGCATAAIPLAPPVAQVQPAMTPVAVREGKASEPKASDSQVAALRRALNAVVGVQVSATDGAPSARSLGQDRTGSGVFIDADGLILTIGYLLLEADTIEVTTHEGRTFPARQVGYDLATGFGLVRPLVPVRDVKPAPLGRVADLKNGEALMVSVASDGQLGVGVTRVVDRRAFSGYWEYHIETALFTAPPVANHSGAPVFNQKGELLGIGSLFVSNTQAKGRATPGNMFVPVDLLNPVLEEMRSTGTTRASHRPWLGVSSQEEGGHVQIVRVDSEGPAKAAGLHVGDVVLEVDGVQVRSLESFYKKVWARTVGDGEVELTVRQGSEVRKIRVKAVDRMLTLRKPQGI